MATNDFKPFATGTGANVMSQAEYQALAALLTGFQSGKASSAQVNKALRQATFIASALAQFVSDQSGQNVLDDGNTAGFIAKLKAGFAAQYLTRNNPFAEINTDGTAPQARNNLGFDALGIGTAAVTPLSSLDWQTYNFISGANYLVTFSNMINTPTGISFTSSTQVWVRVVGSAGSFISVEVIPATTVDSNYKIYEVHFNKAPGSRTFSVRQVYTNVDLADANGVVGRLLNVQTFTSSGTYTPTAGTKFVIVEGIGGGGAGGGAPVTASGNVGFGAGGHAGAYGKGKFTISEIGTSQSVSVGAGGVATTNSGGNGGNSSFGSLVVFTGGGGGPSAGNTAPPLSAGNGNVPAVASNGANLIRGSGMMSTIGLTVSISVGYSGAGANSPFGSGGGSINNTGPGQQATGFGAGGSGGMALSANATARTGGNGAPGFVVIYEYA